VTDKPVAIRIARPHSTEDDYLTHELDTLTRSSVILVGANSRPAGVVLRFEVTLATGRPVLRGEGRVVEYKAEAFRGLPGLVLRFTKLDPKSKQLVDRAHAMREGGGKIPPSSPGIPPAAGSEPSIGSAIVEGVTHADPEPEPAEVPKAEAPPAAPPVDSPTAPPPPSPPPPPEEDEEAGAVSVDLRGLEGPPTTPPPPAEPPTAPPPPHAEAPQAGSLPPTTPPPPESPTRRTQELPPEGEREALLAKLRERRRTLADDAVAAIVADGARLRATG
jgi:hypothetical protein